MNNRHARRRAAAQARRFVAHGTTPAPRRTSYAHRLVAAIGNGGIPRGVHSVSCVHSASCGMRSGAQCDCTPEISVTGPDGVTTIDECGTPKRHVNQ
jgi:hypothetical protein